jgi:hypothetical protein
MSFENDNSVTTGDIELTEGNARAGIIAFQKMANRLGETPDMHMLYMQFTQGKYKAIFNSVSRQMNDIIVRYLAKKYPHAAEALVAIDGYRDEFYVMWSPTLKSERPAS